MSKSITFVQLLCRCAFIVVHILFLNKKKELKLVVGCYVPTKVRRVINNIATQYEHRMIIFAETQGSFPFFAQTHGKAQSVFLLRPRFKTHKLGAVE